MLVTVAVLLALAMGCGRVPVERPSVPVRPDVLVHLGATHDFLPGLAWSPDGRYLLYTTYMPVPGEYRRPDAGIVHALGVDHLTERSLGSAQSMLVAPEFTSDSREVVLRPTELPNAVVARDITTGRSRVLFRGQGGTSIHQTALSPDGTLVASELVSGTGDDRSSALVLHDLRRDHTAKLGSGREHPDELIRWLPDGRLLWYRDAPYVGAKVEDWDGLYAAKPPSWALTRVRALPAGLSPDGKGVSPDGTWVAGWSGYRETQIRALSLKAHSEALLAYVEGEMNSAAGCPWSPDDRWVAFAATSQSSEEDVTSVFLASTRDHRVVQLLSSTLGEVIGLAWSPDGHRLAFILGDTIEAVTVPPPTAR
jgi:WD40 repeat protein